MDRVDEQFLISGRGGIPSWYNVLRSLSKSYKTESIHIRMLSEKYDDRSTLYDCKIHDYFNYYYYFQFDQYLVD